MDTLNTTVIGAHTTLSLSSHHRWNTLSPSLMPENDGDNNEMKACGPMKIEHPFESDDQAYFSSNCAGTTAQQLQRRQPSGSSSAAIPTTPLASCATATASLSSAFNKRLVSSSRTVLYLFLIAFLDDETCQLCIIMNVGENSNCYSTSATAPGGAATAELSGDRRDSEISVPVSSVANNANDAAQMDIYRDLILRHLIQDINTTCTKLGLPTDPQAWSAEHSARWMSEMCVQFQLPPPRQLYMNGRTLLSMTQDDFMVRAPEGGDTLHAQLQLWKTANKITTAATTTKTTVATTTTTTTTTTATTTTTTTATTATTTTTTTTATTTTATTTVNPSSLTLNATEQGELLTSAQDYLNNFSPSNTDAALDMNCYPNSTYQNVSQEGALLGNATAQQQYYVSAHTAGVGILSSPSDSEISSNGSSMNDVNTIDGTIIDGRQTGTPQFPRHSGTVHLWHFIRELLDHPKQYSSCVRWVDRQEGTFKIESSHHLARFWGQRKNRAQMNYDKLSRSLRQYYKKGIIQKPEKKQRLVYKFLPPYNL
ncbi:unnamed protein product [Litomosoides sigmodontis]|uniref:ETS domain-containing protein n=1 Tax=Litomosoides sigmodontis TaxID=42156 RepID=A0A3P6UH45_LITSI|nr:unnamed protein product [Litomosoides sigmodontis]